MSTLVAGALTLLLSQVEPTSAPPSSPTWAPPRYGDAGTSEVNLILGLGAGGRFVGGAGYRYFVIDGVAPGLEATYLGGGDDLDSALVMGSIRAVPVRFGNVAVVLTGRGGRVFVGEHRDGWAVGGGAGVLFLTGNLGVEIGYEVLQLVPDSFCNDLNSCTLHQPVLGVRVIF